MSKFTGIYHEYCYNCNEKFSSKELPVQCPNCTKQPPKTDLDDENRNEYTENCGEGIILSPKSKVFPPGTWQKLRQPNIGDAKEIYQNAKKRVKKITDKMGKICISPGEYGTFQNLGDDIFLEEKCFIISSHMESVDI